MNTTVLLPSSFDSTLGTYLIALTFSFILLGVNFGQVLLYFRKFREDKEFIKYTVIAVFCLNVWHSFLITDIVYEGVVSKHMDSLAILKPLWSSAIHSLTAAVINLIIRAFFSYRIWHFTQSLYIPVVVILISTVIVGNSTYLAITIMSMSQWSELTSDSWSVILSISLDIFADTIIAGYVMLILRQRQRTECAFRRTSSVLDTLIAYSVYTGSLTIVIEGVCLILFQVMPDNFIWQSVFALLCKLYMNSMFGALNARENLRIRNMGGSVPVVIVSGMRCEIREFAGIA